MNPPFLPDGFRRAPSDGPRVSVITATFDSAGTLRETLQSVAGQSAVEDLEHVIIDGGSRDETLEIARAAEHGVVLESGPDSGIYDAFNKGLAACSGELIAFLGSDDVYANAQVIARVIEAAERFPEVDVFHGDMDRVDAGGAVLVEARFHPKFPIDSPQNAENYAGTWLQQVYHPSAFVRRRVFARVGGFDTTYRIAGDTEFLLRAYHAGATFRYLPGVFVRMGNEGISQQRVFLGDLEVLKAFRRHSSSLVKPFAQFARTQVVRVLERRAPRALHAVRALIGSPRASGYGDDLRAS